MENTVFKYSEKTIREKKKILLTMGMMIPFIVILTVLVMSMGRGTINIFKLARFIIPCIIFITLEIVLVSYLMFKKLRSTSLVVSTEGIERIGGKSKELIKYSDIKKFQIKNDKYGKLLFIKLSTDKRKVTIYGFDNMEIILKSLKENVDENFNISEKQYKVDWNNPLAVVIIMIVTICLLLPLMRFNEGAYRVFNMIFPLALSTYFLFYKPISKAAGTRFRIFEIVISGIMILATILIFIDNIL
ncbi:hypothetical protein [Clostridium sp. C2-6-12]|uniref:hypothetical protein n=1 Tax=Clostridium sp. C2-6-12 TaxID=2698832 RepID=UPI001369E217|nr:hypothetical protein [Clostridium sp. C2-6-12]